MGNPEGERILKLERRQRLLLAMNALLAAFVAIAAFGGFSGSASPQTSGGQRLTVSELNVVDDRGVVRVRISGDLPDAIISGRTVPRGAHAAGLAVYDDTGQERGAYATFAPGGNVALTLDNRTGQTATFVAGPDAGSALNLTWMDSDVDLRVDEDGPAIHATRAGRVAFHAPPLLNPRSSSLCQGLREAIGHATNDALWSACRSRSSEAACRACLGH